MAKFPCPLPVDQLLAIAHQELSVLEAHEQGAQSTRERGRAAARPFLPSRHAASAPSALIVGREQDLSDELAQIPKSEQQKDAIESTPVSMPDTLKQLVEQSEPLPPGSLLPDFGPIAPPTKPTMSESRSSSKPRTEPNSETGSRIMSLRMIIDLEPQEAILGENTASEGSMETAWRGTCH